MYTPIERELKGPPIEASVGWSVVRVSQSGQQPQHTELGFGNSWRRQPGRSYQQLLMGWCIMRCSVLSCRCSCVVSDAKCGPPRHYLDARHALCRTQARLIHLVGPHHCNLNQVNSRRQTHCFILTPARALSIPPYSFAPSLTVAGHRGASHHV